jgi:cation diffusion facilitator CzcD-associated flavoprotein CzcO
VWGWKKWWFLTAHPHTDPPQGGALPEVGVFDAVVVANGHFDVPWSPELPGLGAFRGRVIHSRYYDSPQGFEGQRVLCVGYKSSGTDVAK